MVIIKSNKIIISLLVLGACASGLKEQMRNYRQSLELNQFEKADSILQSSQFKEDPKSKLLWHLENGTLQLVQKNYDGAINHFQNSLQIIDESYTKKISSIITSSLLSDSDDDFIGAGHERSLAFYYLARSYYEKFQVSKNKQDLFSARAAILAWDSYFQEQSRSKLKTFYQSDLLLKVFGAQIHEVIESRNDLQIALQLYKDALIVSQKLGGIFPYFNKDSVSYTKNLSSTHLSKFFAKTDGFNDLEDYLKFKILNITYDIRRYEFDKISKDLNVAQSLINRAKKNTNVRIIIESGLTSQKVGERFDFGLKGLIKNVKDPATRSSIEKFGAPLISAFAMNILGLNPKNTHSSGQFVMAYETTKFAVKEFAISFEMPLIKESKVFERKFLIIENESGKQVERRPLILVTHTSDLARLILEERAIEEFSRRGTRVALKHLAAVITSYSIYQQLKTPENDYFARTLAIGGYVAATKGIDKLESVDLRQWLSLPEAITVQEFNLKKGKYKLSIRSETIGSVNDAKTKSVGYLEVGNNTELFTFRL